jgi:hypothetical protein
VAQITTAAGMSCEYCERMPAARPSTASPMHSPAGASAPAAYPDTADAPDAALRASLGCGNPLAIADLQPGDTVLDLGSGGGLDLLLSARRVGPAGTAYGLDASTDMLTPRPRQRGTGRSGQRPVPARPHRGHPPARRARRRHHLQLRHQSSSICPPTRHESSARHSESCGQAGAWASATSSPTTTPIRAS